LGRSSFQASVLLLVWLASTAISPAADKPSTSKYHFFPPAPDAPRLQFLVAYSSEKDLGGKGGGLMTFITGTPPPNKLLGKPYGAAIKDKKIYVCDTGYGEVLKLDLEAKRMSSVDSRGPGAFKLPVNIAVDSDGLLYVTDSGRNEVVILDRNENFVGTIGQTNVIKPRDVAPTADRLYVGDIETHSIHVFDRATRKPLFDIPRPEDATNIAHKLFQPANVAVDGKGRIYASDVGANRVQVYDADGKYLRTVGQYGDNSGEFSRPKGIALDRENRLYAVDAATQVVQLFDDAGRVLMWFGDPRSSNVGLQLPAKVALDYDNVGLFQRYAAPDFQVEYLVLVTSQFGPRKVSVFGFGHKK
jgi:DNA-binding beta-propeller fold protein YncE